MSRAPSERPGPTGMPVLRADERLVEELAEVFAGPIAERLRRRRRDEEGGFLDVEGAARHLSTSRKRIHELTSARVIRPDGTTAGARSTGARRSTATSRAERTIEWSGVRRWTGSQTGRFRASRPGRGPCNVHRDNFKMAAAPLGRPAARLRRY